MKRTIAAITAFGALTGGLSAQLDFGTLTNITNDNTFFPRLAKAMYNDRNELNQTGLVYAPLVPLYSDFVFDYELDANLLPIQSSGDFRMNTSVLNNMTDGSLHFRHVPNFLPAFELTSGNLNELKLEVAFIHFEAAATNRFGLSRDPALVDSLNLFTYTKNSWVLDRPPLSYELTGTGTSDQFSFYATVDYAPGNPPNPRPVGPHFQDNEDYWRIFQLMDPTADGVNAPAVYIMALEDQGVHPGSNYDFNDGFFLIQGFITPVPEPSIIGLGGILALVGFITYRRRKNTK